MKSLIAIVILVVVVAALIVEKFTSDRDRSASTKHISHPPRTVNSRDVVIYSERVETAFRVNTTRDVLPGGHSAAMVPILVDWDGSNLSKDGYIVVRNINDGGNPVSGVTVLRSAHIRQDRIKAVEFILVPLGWPEAISHGQLRFVFEVGGAEFIGGADAVGEPDELGDLILSWEAWRPPGVDFSVLRGMDPSSFELTMRGYSGPQRFLEDALGSRDWNVYTLQLPGGRESFAELLKVSLAIGDGAARYSISQMLEKAETEWAVTGPDSEIEGGDAAAEWRKLEEIIRSDSVPTNDPRFDMKGKTGFQSLLRSCATMALYCVDVAVTRLIESGLPHEGMRPTRKPKIDDEPEWMAQLACTDIAGVFVRAPKVILFARANPTAIPDNIPDALDDAGLLVRENGKPIKRRYSMGSETPWGHRDQLLIR